MGADAEHAALARLGAAVPDAVRQVCQVLRDRGHEAFAVGGAVRDAVLNRPADDWDVATSARPDDVMALFDRTIPTGIDHGTVTVIAGPRGGRVHVEVTTFRGEGAYSDARRPDSVRFGVPLTEDLARRDFVCNAIAYDPIDAALRDPFGGAADIHDRRLRAVGDAKDRFTEDGLRIMRAVRFVAVLEFSLDPDTETAIEGALGSLAKVSQERVRVELFKLLGAERPGPALDIAKRRGVIGVVLPEVDALANWGQVMTRVTSCAPDPVLRLGAMLVDVDAGAADAALRRLTVSNADRARAVRIATLGRPELDADAPERAVRRALAAAERKYAADVAAVWAGGGAAALAERARVILDRGDALGVGDLAITGKQVMTELAVAPGPIIGEVLRALLERVLDDPGLNDRAVLAAMLPEVRAQLDAG